MLIFPKNFMNIKKIFIFASVDMEKLPYFHGETGILSKGVRFYFESDNVWMEKINERM